MIKLAITKDYKSFVLEQLNLLEEITCRPMMGEYLLYYKCILFGGIYDDRLLVKIVLTNEKYNMQKALPYESAKFMYFVDGIENKENLKEVMMDTYNGLLNK